MSFSSEDLRNDYVAAGGTDFNFTLPIYSEDDIAVYNDGSLAVKGTHYTVRSGADVFTALPESSLPATGFVRFAVAPTNGVNVSIVPVQPFKQTSEYTTEPFPAARVEKDFDKGAMIGRRLREIMRRTLQLNIWSVKTLTLDEPVADKFLRYSGDAQRVIPSTIVPAGSIATPVATSEGGLGQAVTGVAKGSLPVGLVGGTFDKVLVGADDTIIQADSAQTPGLIWRTIGAALLKMLTTKGDIAVSTGAVVQRKAVGANGTILEADSAQADGIKWTGNPIRVIHAIHQALAASETKFLGPWTGDSAEATGFVRFRATRAGVLRNLRVEAVTSPGANNITFTVRINGVDSALVVVLTGSTVGSNVADAPAVAAGDLITIKAVASAGITTTTVSVDFEHTTL